MMVSRLGTTVEPHYYCTLYTDSTGGTTLIWCCRTCHQQ